MSRATVQMCDLDELRIVSDPRDRRDGAEKEKPKDIRATPVMLDRELMRNLQIKRIDELPV